MVRSVRSSSSILVVLVNLVALVVLSGCAGSIGGRPSPAPAGGPVVTEADAVARVLAREPRLVGIGPRDPDRIGQAAWYEVAPASGVGAFIVSVRVGWGDCEAGCIDEHTWVYSILPDGTVNLQSEGGAEVPAEAWPSAGSGRGVGTGIAIAAVAGPTCPVETVPPDPACEPRPVAGAVVDIQDAAGARIASVTLDAAGLGFAEVPAGGYLVVARSAEGMMGMPEPQDVVVEAGRATAVTLAFDTGLR